MVKSKNNFTVAAPTSQRLVAQLLLFVTPFLVMGNGVVADSLAIRSPKDDYLVGEPVVIHVILHLDTPVPEMVFGSPAQEANWQRKVNRRLDVELYRGDEKICSGAVGGGGLSLGVERNEFEATVLVLLGTEIPGGKQSDFVLWNLPGTYELLLRDDENLISNRITIKLLGLQGKAAQASQLWSSQGVNTVLLLFDREHGEDAQTTFRDLCDGFSELVFGKYACAALGFREVEHLKQGRDVPQVAATRSTTAAKLTETISAFDPGHPLRSRAMLELLVFQRTLGEETSGQLLRDLRSETKDGLINREIDERIEVSNRRRQMHLPNSD